MICVGKDLFEVLDCMKGELQRRFSGHNQSLLLGCDSLNPKSSVFLNFEAIKPLAESYSSFGIACDKLKSQAIVAKNMFQSNTAAQTTANVVKKLWEMNCAFPDLVKFAQLALTIPVSSANAERSFSNE